MKCPRCGGPAVDMEGKPLAVAAMCFNCFLGRPWGPGRCNGCRREKPLVRRYLSGLFCDVHAPPRIAN